MRHCRSDPEELAWAERRLAEVKAKLAAAPPDAVLYYSLCVRGWEAYVKKLETSQ
jgi:hypothetical protein